MKTFRIEILRNNEKVGTLLFDLGERESYGTLRYILFEPELRGLLKGIETEERDWPNLVSELIDRISLRTRSRYILRFHETPSAAGRFGDSVLSRLMDRITKALEE